MADITNVEAVRFCNEKVRPIANRLAMAYYLAKAVQNEWFANSMLDLIPNEAGDIVIDGSATDGRHVISGAHVVNVITRSMELVADMEANSNAKLNTILSVATEIGM